MSLVAHLDIGRSDRVAVDRTGTLRDVANTPIDIVVDNLSRTGCLFVLHRELQTGALVSIGIPGIGLRYARISRVDYPQYACAFLAPVSDAEIVTALSADTLVAGAFPPIPDALPPAPDMVEEQPYVATLPVPARIAIVAGTSIVLWAMVIAVGGMIAR